MNREEIDETCITWNCTFRLLCVAAHNCSNVGLGFAPSRSPAQSNQRPGLNVVAPHVLPVFGPESPQEAA
jgi:hypothetical protein